MIENFNPAVQIFQNLTQKCVVLVFVDQNTLDSYGTQIRQSLKELNDYSISINKEILIKNNIGANFNLTYVQHLWKTYNNRLIVPRFEFIDINGSPYGISYFGLPTSKELIDRLKLCL